MTCEILSAGKPVTLADQALFESYLKQFPPQTSELTFTNVFCWAEVKHHLYCEYKGHLILTARGEDCCLLVYAPVGPHPEQIMSETFGSVSRFHWTRIPEHLAHRAEPGVKATHDRDNDDYVYLVSDLRELVGKKYDGKRNFIKRFAALGPEVRRLTQTDAAACLQIQERWLESQKGNPSAKQESTALMKTLEHLEDFKLHGVGAFVDGKLAGFAIGEALAPGMFVEHFEKGLPEYTGVYPFILHEFAKSLPPGFTHLNREQDLGIEGIRKSKDSWGPAYLQRKYTFKVRCATAVK